MTTPTPEAIEAAAEAFAIAEGKIAFSRLSKADQKYYRELMTAALSAAALVSQGQATADELQAAYEAGFELAETETAKAKAEALREAAGVILGPSEFLMEAATCRMIAQDLYARAEALESEATSV